METSFEDLSTARKLLGLKEEASYADIKEHFYEKIKKYHPDKNRSDNDAHWESIRITKAYEIVMKYCQKYKISFRKEDYLKQETKIELHSSGSAEYHKWWMDTYGDDPAWGKGGITDD